MATEAKWSDGNAVLAESTVRWSDGEIYPYYCEAKEEPSTGTIPPLMYHYMNH